MKTAWKFAIVVVLVTAITFMTGPNSPAGEAIWGPMPAEVPEPQGAQLPLLMFYGLISGAATALAVAFLIFGWPLVRRVTGPSKPAAVLLMVSIVWIMGNWWFHDNLHMVNGYNLWGLIALEYGFHATMIAAVSVIAFYFWRSLRQGTLPVPTATQASKAVDA